MVSGAKTQAQRRRLRLGMVGGGPGAFIGAVHRIAARLDDRYELVAAALSSDAERSRAGAAELHVAQSAPIRAGRKWPRPRPNAPTVLTPFPSLRPIISITRSRRPFSKRASTSSATSP